MNWPEAFVLAVLIVSVCWMLRKHPVVKAWEVWRDSDDGKMCAEGQIAGQYLENRLWRAFMAGVASQTLRQQPKRERSK